MKRLIFLISLLIAGQVSANTKTVVIGDSTFFNYTHTTAIDSAQLILIRGAVKDTLSLMPITGSSHKIVEWEDIFNQVDSAGNYNIWIEPYSSAAIIDTILGDCLVELAARDVNAVQISGDVTAANNFETMLDGTGGQILSLRGLHIRGTTGADTAFIAAGYGAGVGGFFYGGATNAHGLYAGGQGTGEGAKFYGGASGTGFYAAGQGTGHGARFYGGATSGIGLNVAGRGSGHGAYFFGGADGGFGLYAGGQGTGDGARFYGGATNGDGLSLAAQGTGLDLNAPLFIDGIWDEDTTGHGTASSFAVMLKDTTAYQGATGAGGDGPRLCSLMVVNATPAAITDGTVSMTSGGTVYSGVDISGAGFAVFNLTDATWTGLAYATGYAQDTIPQTFVISASVKDTITMTAYSVSSPSAADKVTCYLTTYDIMGAVVENAKLTATVNGNGPWFAADDSAAIMIPKKVSEKTNSSGYVEIELWESAEVIDAEGNNPTFDFTLEKSNYLKWEVKDRTTPDADNWNIK